MRNRERVCEIYGVDPNRCSCHHIIQRSDVKGSNPKFPNYDVDQLSNLYPFPIEQVEEHYRTHRLLEAMEGTPSPKRKYKRKLIYQAPKQRRKRRR